MRVRWSSECHVVAKILKRTCMRGIGCHAFREQFVTYAWQMARHGENLAVLTDFVTLKWHDLARHIARHCGNKIRASVTLAIAFNKHILCVKRIGRKNVVEYTSFYLYCLRWLILLLVCLILSWNNTQSIAYRPICNECTLSSRLRYTLQDTGVKLETYSTQRVENDTSARPPNLSSASCHLDLSHSGP